MRPMEEHALIVKKYPSCVGVLCCKRYIDLVVVEYYNSLRDF